MKKRIFSLMVACLSLVSSLMSFQAAAQDNLTESQVKSIVEGVLESNAKKAGKTDSASSLYGPRFEIIRMPDRDFTFFKFDKETGDTWEINTYTRPGEVNYQLIVDSWHHITLLNVHTGTMWESRLSSGRNAAFEDFKVVEAGS